MLGGTLIGYDEEAIASMAGVRKVVRVGDNAVAVIADGWWQANTALEAMPIEWDMGPNAEMDSASIKELVESGLDAEDAFLGNMNGDVDKALAEADTIVEAVYGYPSLNHATMEPMNATALYTEEKCEVWCPTQNGESALAAAAQASGLSVDKCDVHKTILGGGFGRRGMSDYVTQAVLIAKQMPGTPIKLLWSREEDMKQGFYHPVTMAKMQGALDADGNLTGLKMRISGQSILATILPDRLVNGADFATFQGLLPYIEGGPLNDQLISYSFPNLKIDHAMRNPAIRPGFWRGVNVNQNAIYMECFLDELAHKAGRDALEFRLALMQDLPKNAAVLKAAAEQGGWGSGDGKARGLATCYAFGSYVAACAEVSVDGDGELTVERIVAATDPGYAVNPQQIEAQVEGSFVYGLSALLYQDITFEQGQVQETNFDTFESLRIDKMPKVETIVMPSGGFWGGVGEPTIAVAAPAVMNAIFVATGKRVRQVPLRGQDLRATG